MSILTDLDPLIKNMCILSAFDKQDRSRRCKYIQSNMTFSVFFCHFFFRNYSSNRQNIIKFVISGSELVEIDTSLARFQKFYFWRPFWFFSKTRFSTFPEFTDQFCWFSIANIGRQLCTLCSILKKIEAKLRLWECRNKKHTKWPPWRHPFWIFKIGEKRHWQIS